MAKDKYEFIQELLNNKKLTLSQKEKVLLLAAKEIKINEIQIEERLIIIEQEMSLIRDTKVASKNNEYEAYHNPLYISQYLNKFKESTDLKWTTHPWDNKKYAKIEDFLGAVNDDKEFMEIFKSRRDLFNLLKYFIYKPNVNVNENNLPEYGWPNLPEIKIGWQYPNDLLLNWSRDNFNDKSENELKTPFQFLIPKELRPKKLVKGKEIKVFEDVVEIFKTEIQFRELYFYNETKKISDRMTDFVFDGIEDFKILNFYTYTQGVLNAVNNMLDQIKRNETATIINFSYTINDNILTIDISQLNSFPNKELLRGNLKNFMGGGLNSIAENLFSLAHFSVLSKFSINNSEETWGELEILHEESTGRWESKNRIIISSLPRFKKYNDQLDIKNGFTYRMKFYI